MAIILLTPYYAEQNIQRKKELDQCLATNVMNPLISQIILVCDETVSETTIFPFDKVTMHRLGKRATFSDMFYRVAPKYVTDDDIVIVSNSDIYFDDSLSKLKYIRWDKEIALSCSRWDRACNMADLMPVELKDSRDYVVYPQRDSQDFWIFKGEIKGMYSEFYLGRPGADNRITYEMEKADYWVFNPSKEIKGYHLHESNYREYNEDRQANTVPPPYKLMFPTDLSVLKTYTPKKIGHIGMYRFLNAEGSIGNGLQANGDYRFLDWTKYCNNWVLDPKNKAEFESKCIELAKWADIVFMQIQTPNIISKELAKKMSESQCKVINWDGDVRSPIPQWKLDIAPYCITMFTNDTDTETMRNKGFRSEYLQIGFPPEIYNPKGYVNKDAEPIVFLANNYYDAKEMKHLFPLGKDRQDMAFYLKEKYGDKFGIYGNGWSGLESGVCVNEGVKESSIYRGAKVAINYSQFNYSRYSSDRILRIMGSGCMCITHRFPDIEKDFKIGEHLAVFDTLEELTNVIDYFLEHEDERKRIAEAGCKFVHRNCTWDKRINQLLKMNL